MKLESIMLSKVNQNQKVKSHMLSFTCGNCRVKGKKEGVFHENRRETSTVEEGYQRQGGKKAKGRS